MIQTNTEELNKINVFHHGVFKSPIGSLEITSSNKGIRKIIFKNDPITKVYKVFELIEDCKKQLHEYFIGQRKHFTIPLDIIGSEFQKLVWMSLMTIPYGEKYSYGKVADLVGDSKSVRAVGMANNKNNIPIIIPCHRVVGIDGSLTGYAGGLWRKDWLIKHEENYSNVEKQMELF
jgi:methylated-DNA-[protein]-cysteine S-methyltransferase